MPRNVTVQVGDELAAKMEKLPDVNWSQVVRNCIEKYSNMRLTPLPLKGELVEGLENYLSEKSPTTEDKEKARKDEIERFTKKWGKADPYPFTNYTEIASPYVELSKRKDIKHGDRTIARLHISNSRVLAKRVVELDEKGWGKYNKALYPQDIQNITDYFKSKGFTIAEESFTQDQVMMYVLGIYGSQGREQARQLASSGVQYFGLFATDKEDVVFIAYREVRPK